MSDQQLMNVLKFDETDLQANRNERLSEKQKARLEKAEKSSKGCNSILGMFLVGIGLVGVGIAVAAAPALYEEERGAMIALILGFGIVWPLIWGGLGVSSICRSFAKVEIKLKKAEGQVNLVKVVRDSYNPSTKMHSKEEVYELHIGRKTFEVDSELADVMMQGDVYAVYFADFNHKEKSKEILSVELLTNGGDDSALQLVPADDMEVVEFVKRGDAMGAIRMHRSIHGSGFEEAKAVVEDIKMRLGY